MSSMTQPTLEMSSRSGEETSLQASSSVVQQDHRHLLGDGHHEHCNTQADMAASKHSDTRGSIYVPQARLSRR